jgi:integrase/recombinase XerD
MPDKERDMTTLTSENTTPDRVLDDRIEPFLKQLRDAGYAERTLRKKRTVTRAFARWLKRKRIVMADLNDGHVATFVARLPRRRKAHVKFELAVLRLFFGYLRAERGLPCPAPQERTSVADGLLRSYEDYLRQDRGLAENSVHVYVPFIRDLLASQFDSTGCITPQSFDALSIRDFVLGQTGNRSAEYVRLLATALRSFFRFLFLSGQIPRDLAASVPRVCKYRQSAPPAFLSPEEVAHVLAAPDRSTPTGRRDYAILLLLARLGLRAGEIVSLELDDIRWRTAEIVVRGKGRIVDHLPLLRDIGEALAAYLHEDRGVSSSRRIFLRIWAPHIGLTGPAAVGHIVRLALARAGIRRSGRGAAHLFRHGLATKMIRNGASLSEISEVLRHRSQMTTSIYTQVAFESLRTVAQPWPVTGGAR